MIAGDLTLFKSTQFTVSVPYMQDEYVWCVSRSGLIPHWRKCLLFVKNSETRIIGTILFIGTIFGCYGITGLEKQPLNIWSCFFFMFILMLGFPYPFEPRTPIVRLICLIAFVVALWCVTIISAFLTLVLPSSMYYKQINTIDEIIIGNLHLAGGTNILEHLRNQNSVRLCESESNSGKSSHSNNLYRFQT